MFRFDYSLFFQNVFFFFLLKVFSHKPLLPFTLCFKSFFHIDTELCHKTNEAALLQPGREREKDRQCQTLHTHPEVSKANFQEESRPDAMRGRKPLFIYFCLSGCQ